LRSWSRRSKTERTDLPIQPLTSYPLEEVISGLASRHPAWRKGSIKSLSLGG
jgi:hypothetical protein